MKSINRLLVAASGALIIGTPAALAGPPVQGSELKSLFAGAMLYTSDIPVFFTKPNFQWKFTADGTVSTSYSLKATQGGGGNAIEKSDSGTWQVSGNNMCIKFKQLFSAAQHCFMVQKATSAPKKYGKHMFQATMVNSGKQWLFAIDK